MRAARETYLPKEPKEETPKYDLRLSRSFLYPGYANTVETLTSKPFSRPVTVGDDLPIRLQPMLKNIDRQGSGLTQFAADVFQAGVDYGRTHIFIDYPDMRGVERKDQELKRFPYFTHYKPTDVLSWKTEVNEANELILTEVHLRETRIEENEAGDEDREVVYIRVITLTDWKLYKESGKDEFKLEDSGPFTLGFIPLLTFYTNRVAYMEACPPLRDLADLNIAHWQSASDQTNILRFIRAAILVLTGLSSEEMDQDLVFGPNVFWKFSDPQAAAKFAEHNGAGIESGWKHLELLEKAMEALGMQPFVKKTTQVTATERLINEQQSTSAMQAWIGNLEQVLTDAFAIAAKWVKGEIPESFKVNIFNDFAVSASTENADFLLKSATAKLIRHETFLREIQRRGILSEAVDIDDEIADLGMEVDLDIDGTQDDTEDADLNG